MNHCHKIQTVAMPARAHHRRVSISIADISNVKNQVCFVEILVEKSCGVQGCLLLTGGGLYTVIDLTITHVCNMKRKDTDTRVRYICMAKETREIYLHGKGDKRDISAWQRRQERYICIAKETREVYLHSKGDKRGISARQRRRERYICKAKETR